MNMTTKGQIAQIEKSKILIIKEDGSYLSVSPANISYNNFLVGDNVSIYQTNDLIIVSESEAIEASTNNTVSLPNIPDCYEHSDKKRVNKIVYLLLAFFLGGLGAHRFYSGRIGLGLLYLFFCWTYIPFIIAIIDFIIGITKPADNEGNIYL